MTRPAIVFLILLRLAIGWHFLFEGIEKYKAGAWSSEPYLREASGPLAPVFHDLAGDPLGERLTPRPVPPGEDPTKVKLYEYMPPRLGEEWQAWFKRFVKHYDLSGEQLELAETKLQQRESQYVNWLLTAKKTIEKPSPYGAPATLDKSIPDWTAEYRKLQEEGRALEKKELPAAHDDYGRKQVSAQIQSRKDDANRIRRVLKSEVDQNTREMQESVREVLTPEEYEKSRLSDSTRPCVLQGDLLAWADFLVPLGLVIIGGCLMLGFLTRPACIMGAVLLLSFYLAMPPWPGTPENLRAEGHYLIINKNMVEMLALLVLACLPTGRWVGLDRLLCHCCKRGAKKSETAGK